MSYADDLGQILLKAYNEGYAQGKSDMAKELKDCRNELCLHCGKYKLSHMGACDGCRWKELE